MGTDETFQGRVPWFKLILCYGLLTAAMLAVVFS